MKNNNFIIMAIMISLTTIFAINVNSAQAEESIAKQITVQKELVYRVKFGSSKDVAYLISKGGNVNATDESRTLLTSIAAARANGFSVPILRELVKGGADLNIGGANNLFPIIIASRNNDIELMKYLLTQKVDVNVLDKNGVTPYKIAKYQGNDEVLDLIKDLVDKHAEDAEYRKSEENHQIQLRGLLENRCQYQYTYYYYKTGMAKSPENIDQIMADYNSQIQKNLTDLINIFGMDRDTQKQAQRYVAEAINDELTEMISNRNRRRLGVGSDGDKEKRCTKIADKWLANHKTKE